MACLSASHKPEDTCRSSCQQSPEAVPPAVMFSSIVSSFSCLLDILRAKFAVPELAEMLEATGDTELEEGNHWHDNRWGRCTCERCSTTKTGQNWLGKKLMQIRGTNRARFMHIENLEKVTSHLNRPALIALAARPGVGKTTLAMNIAIHEAER